MKTSLDATTSRWRFYFVLLVMLIISLALVMRLVVLSVLDRHFLLNQGDARTLRNIAVPAYRGMITDRNGKPIAVSTPVESVWVDPRKLSINDKDLSSLTQLLQLNSELVKKALVKNKQREFLYLKRRIDPWLANKVKQLKIPGVYLQPEFRRYYPEGEVAAHILGFTNVDDHGQEGLELAYDEWLRGVPGKRRVLKDLYGNIVSDIGNISEPKPGKNLVLSIDRRIQYIAFKALQEAVEENQATSGSIVVLDPKTGEILAMTSQPSFNPNQESMRVDESHRNRAITDVFEPGSTMKAFSFASAIDSGHYHANSLVDTYPGWFVVGGKTVRDEHTKGVMTLEKALQISSNVATAKITLSLPPMQLYSFMQRVGFGESTHSGFPGERSGVLIKENFMRPFDLATLAFGYAASVTTIQLAKAYTVIANHGVKRDVTFLRVDKPLPGVRVIKEKVAVEVLQMLQSVIDTKGATGYKAMVPNYHVAGKTGTAVIAGPHGYLKHHYYSSFIGIAPVTDPRLVIAVVIRDPHGKNYYATDVAAPAFAKVMASALRILDVPPDNIAAVETQ